ncbi:MAG: SGNH/GDSL hydrolase family protein [Pirellulales bacterium]
MSIAFAFAEVPREIRRLQGKTLLEIPDNCYAIVGQEVRVYLANIAEREDVSLEPIQFLQGNPDLRPGDVWPSYGSKEANVWKHSPKPNEAGQRQRLILRTTDTANNSSDSDRTELFIAPADAGTDREIAILIVGDSLTHATHYPNEWARLLNEPGNPKWTMLGTHKPANAAEGVAHEGYGGWKWQTFVERYEPKPDRAKRIHSSPFVFPGADGKPGLDLPRYFREACGGRKPDYVTFLLGINDCFAAPADDAAALDKHIDGVFAHADKLLAEFHKAAADAKLAVCLTPPPNSRPEAFTANYKDKYPRAGWLKIQRRLVERQMQHFSNREDERIFIVPTNLDLDTVGGYPENNAVHPNKEGYARIAASLHAWLKWQLYNESRNKM